MSTNDRLRRARGLYDAGAFDEAVVILTQLVEEQPRDVDALLLLGAIAGKTKQSIAAVRWFERALTLDPDNAETHVGLAGALRLCRRFDEAIHHLERALHHQPRLRAAYLGLGGCYFERGDVERAGAAYLEALRVDNSAAAAIGLARVLREQRRFELAERTLRTAAGREPGNAEIAATLGILLHETGRDPEAFAALASALSADPANVAALYYSGNVKRDLGCWAEAESFYRRALAILPDHPDALINLADTVAALGRLPEARRLLETVCQTQGSDPDIRYACGIVSLSHGDLAAGWPNIASTVKTAKRKPLRFPHLPKLESLRFKDRKVVIWGDQGIGDEIIYGSFLQDLRGEATQTVCEIDRRLIPLFSRGFPELQFVGRTFEPQLAPPVRDDELVRAWRMASLDRRLGAATHQISLPDLGGWLRPSLSRFPVHAGYLKADGDRAAAFRRALKMESGERLVGLSWKSHNRDIGRHKSMSLQRMVDSLPDPRLRFVSLQYGAVEEEIAATRAVTSRCVDVMPELDCFNDIDGLAALIMACDAVITVSNVTAHLAGSLGQRTALLCPRGVGKPWYWFSSGADSPWYPAMRIFRQSQEESWGAAFVDCAAWLADC